MKILTDILTSRDNKTYCIAKVCFVLSLCVYFIMSFLNIVNHHAWSAMEFSGGISTMAIGFGIQIKLKNDSET